MGEPGAHPQGPREELRLAEQLRGLHGCLALLRRLVKPALQGEREAASDSRERGHEVLSERPRRREAAVVDGERAVEALEVHLADTAPRERGEVAADLAVV